MSSDRVGPASRIGGSEGATPFLFFTGKGGVGKTTIAAATAARLADAGRRVLLVSTEPASSLADVLGAPTSKDAPLPVAAAPGLGVLDLDPQRAADANRERALAPYRGPLPDTEVAAFAEQLASACTIEIASFDTFAHLLTDPEIRDRYDHVVFDTAPTGHTLRLMALPAAWADSLDEAHGSASCLGPLAALGTHRDTYTAAVTTLNRPELTTVALVTRPDRTAYRSVRELVAAIRAYVQGWHERADPISWTKTAEEILKKANRPDGPLNGPRGS
jgi:arsenite-transporting ATPase